MGMISIDQWKLGKSPPAKFNISIPSRNPKRIIRAANLGIDREDIITFDHKARITNAGRTCVDFKRFTSRN